MVRSRTPASLDEKLFFEYLTSIFIPYVDAIRSRAGPETETVILLMDFTLSHRSNRILQTLGEKNVVAITFPVYTTNPFQALDLVFFGALKKLKRTAVGEFDDGSVNTQIIQLLQASEQAATSATIRGSFEKAEMDLDVTTLPFRIRIVEQRVRENPGFKEVWDRNVSLDDLSRRRQLQRFGIIDSGFLPALSVM
jgi:hypothetical protein